MKEERFKRVLDNIYKLQEYGQPPDDVIEDIVQLPGLGAAGGGSNLQKLLTMQLRGDVTW